MSKMIIPIGPQHPALEEPESFTLMLEGERVAAVSVALGYNHRGIEKACENRTYTQDIYLVERICGICSHSHATCFVQAVEAIAGVEIPKRAAYLRVLIGELERIHSHLLWLGIAGHELGFDSLFMYSWKDREIVMDILEMLTGNRVNYGMNIIGGVRRDISPELGESVLKALDQLEERTKYYISLATEETTLIKRLSGVGVLSKEDVLRLGAVGPVMRAAGVKRDVRKDDPYAVYSELDFNVVTDDNADVFGRTIVRVLELIESYKICRQAVRQMPDGPISVKVPEKIPVGEALSRYEAPRGEDIHYVRANGTNKPERCKMRAPTLANLAAISNMIEGGFMADVPIVIAAIDPCFSCTDRMIKVKSKSSGEEKLFDWEGLRSYSIDWYRKQGIDMGGIKTKRKEDN